MIKSSDPRPSQNLSRASSAARTRSTALALLGALALATGCAGANDGEGWSEDDGSDLARPDLASPDIASTGQLEQPIVGAETDTRHTAVLAVASQLQRSQALCTGTLIAPNLVLTAQHCVASTDELVDCRTSEFGSAYSPRNIGVSPNTSLNRGADFFPVREVQVPPGGGDVCGSDIALIILDGKFTTITPMAPRLDSTVIAGEVYTAVGFGDALDEGDPGIRRARAGLEVACGPEQCRLPSALTSTEFIGDSSVCEGDSGGPALDRDGEILGVVSRGEEDCGATIYSAVAPWRDWILSVTTRAIELGDYPAPSWYTALENASPGGNTNGSDTNGSDTDDGDSRSGSGTPSVGDVGNVVPGDDDSSGALPSVTGDVPVRASKDSGCSTSGAGTNSSGPWSALAALTAGIVLWRRRFVR